MMNVAFIGTIGYDARSIEESLQIVEHTKIYWLSPIRDLFPRGTLI